MWQFLAQQPPPPIQFYDPSAPALADEYRLLLFGICAVVLLLAVIAAGVWSIALRGRIRRTTAPGGFPVISTPSGSAPSAHLAPRTPSR